MPFSESEKQKLQILGERIRAVRKEKGLSLEQLAHSIGKDKQSIHSVESAKFNPSYLYLKEVCDGLGITLSALILLVDNDGSM